jgi:hypothetical protein
MSVRARVVAVAAAGSLADSAIFDRCNLRNR